MAVPRHQTTQHLLQKTCNREFKAEHLNEKWVTDVTEFKYGNTYRKRQSIFKRYIRLMYRFAVAYVIGDIVIHVSVFETFDKAAKANPGAHPIFSERTENEYFKDFIRN